MVIKSGDKRDKKPTEAENAMLIASTSSCACFNLRKTARAVTQHYSKFMADTGLKETQFSILSVLKQTGPLPMGHLAEALVMDRTTLTRNLKPLRINGLLKIVPGNDGRTKLVLITPKGSSAFTKALPSWTKAQDTLINVFGQNEWNILKVQLNLLQSMARASEAP